MHNESIYGTLPRSHSQRKQKRRKRSEEELAALIAHHIAFDANEVKNLGLNGCK